METIGVALSLLLAAVWLLVAGAALRSVERERHAKQP
jgi:hypothetical protein